MGKSHFDVQAVQDALSKGKATHPKAEIVPGVVSHKAETKETGLDKEFQKLKKASRKSQNALLRQSCPEALKAFENSVVAFSIQTGEQQYHVVATHGKAGISFPAEVVVRFTDTNGANCEYRFETRPWVNHAKGWRFMNIATFADYDHDKVFMGTLKSIPGECTVILSSGFTVKNRGKSLMDVLTRSVYHQHLKALRPKK